MYGITDEDLAKRRRGKLLAIAVLVALLDLGLWHAARHSVADDTTATARRAEMVQISSTAQRGAGSEVAPWRLIDYASVNWDKVHVEPDPSPFCFAAYDL